MTTQGAERTITTTVDGIRVSITGDEGIVSLEDGTVIGRCAKNPNEGAADREWTCDDGDNGYRSHVTMTRRDGIHTLLRWAGKF